MTDTRKRLAEIEARVKFRKNPIKNPLPDNVYNVHPSEDAAELLAMLKPFVEPVEDADLQDAIGTIHEMNRCSMSAEERAAVVLLRAYRQQRAEIDRLREALKEAGCE